MYVCNYIKTSFGAACNTVCMYISSYISECCINKHTKIYINKLINNYCTKYITMFCICLHI